MEDQSDARRPVCIRLSAADHKALRILAAIQDRPMAVLAREGIRRLLDEARETPAAVRPA